MSWGTYYTVVLVTIGTFTCGHDTEKVDIIKERLNMLEIRFVQDIGLLRKELQTEIDIIGEKITDTEDRTAERRDESDNKRDMAHLLELEQVVVARVNALRNGLKQEKRLRRDLQEKVVKMESDEQELLNDFRATTRNISMQLSSIAANIDFEEDIHNMVTILENIHTTLQSLNIQVENSDVRARNCYDWLKRGHVTNGVYTVYPDVLWRPLEVFCDMVTDGGGWTVFQRRCDGTEDFYRPWLEYRFGFGNLSSEFWLGNEFIHRLTSDGPQELRIELEDFENDHRYAVYSLFSVGPSEDLFRLSLEGFKGDVADSLANCPNRHNGEPFSTFDNGPAKGCSTRYKGGFWYGKCHCVNINGLYLKGEHSEHAIGVNWLGFRGHKYSLKMTEMKFRPK